MGLLNSRNKRTGKISQVPDYYENKIPHGEAAKFMQTFEIVAEDEDAPKGAIHVAKAKKLAKEQAVAEMLANVPKEPIIELDPERVAWAIEEAKNWTKNPTGRPNGGRLGLLGIESHMLLTDEQLLMVYPGKATPRQIRARLKDDKRAPRKDMTRRYHMVREQQKYVKEAIRQMNKKISKHILTQEFIEHFHNKIGPELIVETLHNVLIDEDERTENKLKALSELTKYSLIPSQAQEVKVEVDTSFTEDKRARLAELLGKAQGNNN